MMTKHLILTLATLAAPILYSQAQVDKSAPLFLELKKQDSLFFERGFNQCDLTYLENTIASDLRFYHDKSGFQDRNAFFDNTRKYICSDSGKKPIRKPETGSLSLFPLYENGNLYGAIQSGIHHFFIRETGKEDVWTGTAKFTNVWTLDDNVWKLSEVLSYDHREPQSGNLKLSSLDQLLKENKVPAMGLGIIENGRLTNIEVYGSLDTQNKAPYNSIFKVASLTKPVFALTILKLIDLGLLDLDEPLYKYWVDPDLKEDMRYKKLTPRLILSHQTGFPNWRYLDKANRLTFEFEPGTRYQYSGEGFEYLRKAIEQKLGNTLEDLANEHLFTPAGMKDTRFWWDASMDEDRYARNFDVNGEEIETFKYYEANSAANLLTTVEDYGLFLEYVVNGAGISEKLFSEMQKYQVKLKENDYFGLGWEILTGFQNGEHALIHTGKDPGVSTLAVIFPKSRNGYLIFMNGDSAGNVYEELLTKRLYLGGELWNRR
ncbi:serine hydrolase [Antarcticibacterium arcticum]|uniref:Serine hydrolase n=1 Tax=Antarcticibacterium arcticum TaxID=2585771 RepID=A0A5B8YQY4_9FLAO|nr:serine hydrolase [Antarcticibacterium arcticum]QED38419.1 serine hydrolase [Antarcticibacterium arcticum]